jgi:hypothetical protein
LGGFGFGGFADVVFADVLQVRGGVDDGRVVGAELGQLRGADLVIAVEVGGHHGCSLRLQA